MSQPTDICASPPGNLVPVVPLGRCEGKAECLRVCPYDVFEVRVATSFERRPLKLVEHLKSLADDHRKAFAIRADQCHGCGLCVEACPETTIRLLKPRAR